MNKRLLIITLFTLIALLTSYHLKDQLRNETTFSQATLQYGAKGQDIRELQGRLQFLGYYDGKVDGDFGSATLASLKQFQTAFGLKADGIAGPKTKTKLWEATKNWRPGTEKAQANEQPESNSESAESKMPQRNLGSNLGLSQQDLDLMANAVHGEARGESHEGRVAVAAVILNRLRSESFPNTISGVIFQPGAFTAVADGQIYLTPNEEARRAVRDALNGWDPSDGCIYYFNPDTATSKWIWSRPQVKKIGKHIFCM